MSRLILVRGHYRPWRPPACADCPLACAVTTDQARLAEADAVVYHIPDWRGPPRVEKRPGQLAVAWSAESEVNYPLLADPEFMRQFDLTMTYRQDSTIWCPYIGPADAEALLAPPQEKTASAPAVLFTSTPFERSGRTGYLLALMRQIAIDSYGRRFRNRRLDQDLGRETRLATIARYRFTLAFENSICRDYVSEKFFEPLMVGSVPVYCGAPNIAEFAPAEHCFINAVDFAGPAELGAYLGQLAADERAYDEYLAWKGQGLAKGFLAKLDRLRVDPLCQLCHLLPTARQACSDM